MPIKTICVCDRCDRDILNPADGYIVKGQIYTTSSYLAERKEYISPDPWAGILCNSSAIPEVIYYKVCFINLLTIKKEEIVYRTSNRGD